MMNELFLDISIVLMGVLSFVSFMELPFETDKTKIRKCTIAGLMFLAAFIFLLTLK
jgi:hypothetical protein